MTRSLLTSLIFCISIFSPAFASKDIDDRCLQLGHAIKLVNYDLSLVHKPRLSRELKNLKHEFQMLRCSMTADMYVTNDN